MLMSGEDGRSGSMRCVGTRGEGIGVPIGAQATTFVMGGKQQENTKQEEEQQTSKTKYKQRQTKRNQKRTTGILPNIGQQVKRAEQEGAETHGTSQNSGATKQVTQAAKTATR